MMQSTGPRVPYGNGRNTTPSPQTMSARLATMPTTGIEGRLQQFFELELGNCKKEKFPWLRVGRNSATSELQRQEAQRVQNEWRATVREKAKTAHVLLLMCLNVGIDPPDMLRTEPCAIKECWVDPLTAQSTYLTRGSDIIAERLEEQYKGLHRNALYKRSLEPSVDDVKGLLTQMRQKANDGRVLVHYNGHGVPSVSSSFGELWFFDPEHTKYVTMTITDMSFCVDSPTLYVLDCNSAGTIANYWTKQGFPNHAQRRKDILICACRDGEVLPQNPNVPADILTSCLTTPIKMALEWYYHYSQRDVLLPNITLQMIERIPGDLNNKRSPLGELAWIFTCLTDTIAWCTLPRDQFQRLYRQDMLLVSLFRNFVLADRILRQTGCTPVCHPPMPGNMHNHRLWDAWDLAVESVLCQLPLLLNADLSANVNSKYQPSSFFSDQLTAFEVNIEMGSFQTEMRLTQEQLPCIILCLCSMNYRVRALQLLALYLDMGVWAVNDALVCGIMPYVLRLLQSTDLQFLLCAIWVKILCVDRSEATCSELFRVSAHKALIKVLQHNTVESEASDQAPILKDGVIDQKGPPPSTASLSSVQDDAHVPLENHPASSQVYLVPGMTPQMCQCLACYMLCAMCSSVQNHSGQIMCWNAQMLPACMPLLSHEDASLRAWACLAMAMLVEGLPDAREYFCKENLYRRVLLLVPDPSPYVRAAACALLSRIVGRADLAIIPPAIQERRCHADITVFKELLPLALDVSPLVRQEYCTVLGRLLQHYIAYVPEEAWTGVENDPQRGNAPLKTQVIEVTPSTQSALSSTNPSENPIFSKGITPQPVAAISTRQSASSQPSLQSPRKGPQVGTPAGTPGLSNVAAMYADYVGSDAITMLAKMAVDPFPLVVTLARTILAGSRSVLPTDVPLWSESLVYRELSEIVEGPLFGTNSSDPATDKERSRETRNRDVLRQGLLATLSRPFTSNSGPTESLQRRVVRHSVLTGAEPIVRCRFQQYEARLFLADSKKIFVADVSDGATPTLQNAFTAVMDPRSAIRDMILINDFTLEPLVVVGDSMGNIGVYTNTWISGTSRPDMPLAFQSRTPGTNVKVVLSWRQRDSLLLYGSAAEGKVHLYQLQEERHLQTLTGTGNAGLTSISCDPNSNTIVGGFSDGCVRLWDSRQGKDHISLAAVHSDDIVDKRRGPGQTNSVVTCSLFPQRGQIVVGYTSGTVSVLDVRNMHSSVRRMEVCRGGAKLTGFDVHRVLPIMSCVSSDNTLELYSTRGESLLTCTKIKETTCVVMHPLKPILAVEHEVFIL